MKSQKESLCLLTRGHNHFDLIFNKEYLSDYYLKYIVFTNTDNADGIINEIKAVGKKSLLTAISETDVVYLPNDCGLTESEIQSIIEKDEAKSKKFICGRCFCDLFKKNGNKIICNEMLLFDNDSEDNGCNVPVVLISGSIESINKLPLILELRRIFEEKYELKISTISGNMHSVLFNFHSFPSLQEINIKSPAEGVELFKKFIAEVGQKDHSDLILISLPGCLFGQDEERNFNTEFELQFIDKAVNIDYLIFISSFEDCQPIKEMKNTFSAKFGLVPECVIVSDRLLADNGRHADKGKIFKTISVDSKFYEKAINELKTESHETVFTMDNVEQIADSIINKLNAGYEDFEII